MAMALVHGGAAVGLLCPSVYSFLSGMKPSDIIVSIEEVPDESLCGKLRKVTWFLHVAYFKSCTNTALKDLIYLGYTNV